MPKPVEQKKPMAPAPQAAASDAPAPEPKKFLGFEPLTWAKILPLGAMFFCILFNYTILRDTKVRARLSVCPTQSNAPISLLGPFVQPLLGLAHFVSSCVSNGVPLRMFFAGCAGGDCPRLGR